MRQSTLGTLAMWVTILYTGTSMPVQIYTVWITKNTNQLPFYTLIMMTSTFLIWSIYAYRQSNKNWHIFIPNFLGFICATTLILLKLFL